MARLEYIDLATPTERAAPDNMSIKKDRGDRTYASGTVLTELFGDSPKVKIIAALLSESDVDLNITDIADLAGLHRTTVYEHIEDLEELGVVIQTRKVGGSPMYRINRESTVAEDIAQLEWDLLDVVDEKADAE